MSESKASTTYKYNNKTVPGYQYRRYKYRLSLLQCSRKYQSNHLKNISSDPTAKKQKMRVLMSAVVPVLALMNLPLALSFTTSALCQGERKYSTALFSDYGETSGMEQSSCRRSFLAQGLALPLCSSLLIQSSLPNIVKAEESSSSSFNAQITSKIFIQLKGLPTEESNDLPIVPEDIITIGLFGNDAPQPTSILEQLVSTGGYPAKCKPKEVRTLQREQLEANKVYNACMETQDTKGVNYDLSTVWRVVRDERIDLGAVSGKFVARESPFFEGGNSNLKHDVEGVVSVRKGSDGSFGFTIFPGSGSNKDLDEDNIVIGRVIDGMDVVRRLNQIPVVQSAQGLNYKGFSGGSSKRSAPSRACRYGSSELYCNEFKPLKKVLISKTGTV